MLLQKTCCCNETTRCPKEKHFAAETTYNMLLQKICCCKETTCCLKERTHSWKRFVATETTLLQRQHAAVKRQHIAAQIAPHIHSKTQTYYHQLLLLLLSIRSNTDIPVTMLCYLTNFASSFTNTMK